MLARVRDDSTPERFDLSATGLFWAFVYLLFWTIGTLILSVAFAYACLIARVLVKQGFSVDGTLLALGSVSAIGLALLLLLGVKWVRLLLSMAFLLSASVLSFQSQVPAGTVFGLVPFLVLISSVRFSSQDEEWQPKLRGGAMLSLMAAVVFSSLVATVIMQGLE